VRGTRACRDRPDGCDGARRADVGGATLVHPQ
jgi:hypothetical protein